MPLKLILIFGSITYAAIFVGLNYENSSDLRFWFGPSALFESVPIVVSLITSYLLGAFSFFCYALLHKVLHPKRTPKTKEKGKRKKVKDDQPPKANNP